MPRSNGQFAVMTLNGTPRLIGDDKTRILWRAGRELEFVIFHIEVFFHQMREPCWNISLFWLTPALRRAICLHNPVIVMTIDQAQGVMRVISFKNTMILKFLHSHCFFPPSFVYVC
jgi:hypothetical protein